MNSWAEGAEELSFGRRSSWRETSGIHMPSTIHRYWCHMWCAPKGYNTNGSVKKKRRCTQHTGIHAMNAHVCVFPFANTYTKASSYTYATCVHYVIGKVILHAWWQKNTALTILEWINPFRKILICRCAILDPNMDNSFHMAHRMDRWKRNSP